MHNLTLFLAISQKLLKYKVMMEKISAKFHEWLGIPYKLHTQQSGEGPVIIMLHGIATSSASWKSMLPFLVAHYRCITIDLVGFGKSPKPNWYSYTPEEHTASIHRTIKSLKLKEPFVLMGHSMGSLLALQYASDYPGNVSRLIMLSTPIYNTPSEADKARIKWRLALYSKAYKYIRNNKDRTLKNAKRISKIPRNKSFEITEKTWIPFSKSLEECIEKQKVKENIANTNIPIDIYYGTLDQLLVKSNILMLSKHKNVKLHPVRAGHFISSRYAQSVADYLLLLN
jgi:pimeloyl-ACP methyl ester carboxylesterase